jgi:hypothetical protein
MVIGKVYGAGGSSPDKNAVEVYAYVQERPGEILGKTAVGCGYDLESMMSGWVWFEAGNFASPWAINDEMRIIVVDPLLHETGFVDLVLDNAGYQQVSDIHLASGDVIGPVVSNTLVNGTSHAFIPRGTRNVLLTATIDDAISGDSVISRGEYFIDTDPGVGNGTMLNAGDGLFDSPREEVKALIDTSSWAEGSIHLVSVRGKDTAGQWGTKQNAAVEVAPSVYQFLGFLPPIKSEDQNNFKMGRTVPVKFQLKDTNGNFAYNGIARLKLQKYDGENPVGQLLSAVSSGGENNGNEFRFDTQENQYIYNLSTGGLTAGRWNLIVSMENGDTYEVFIRLR